jgi:hypothetical protein
MAPQLTDWSCSSCSLDWVKVATGMEAASDRYTTTMQIGYTDQINPWVGLTNVDGPGAALQQVLAEYGQASQQAWLDFDAVYALAQQTTGMMSGTAWFHWVALRGVQGTNLWIANSAPNYMGVWDILSRSDFERLGGFSVVYLV